MPTCQTAVTDEMIVVRHETITETTNRDMVSPAKRKIGGFILIAFQSKIDHAHHHDETTETIAEEIAHPREVLQHETDHPDDQTETATFEAAVTIMDLRADHEEDQMIG